MSLTVGLNMALRDNEAEDEAGFYEQGFEANGIVSIWLGRQPICPDDTNVDILQDLCGVGYYELDNQEISGAGVEKSSIHELLMAISYSRSFANQAIQNASNLGLTDGFWLLVQFDFAYEPSRVVREIAVDPIFIGQFMYVMP